MARPKKEGLDYFPHDTDSVNDEKIEALRMLYGNDGYAFYFILLERIYRTKEAELDVSDAETIQILSKKVGINEETFYKILETCFKRGCFDRESYENRQVLTSNGIKKRVAPVVEKRERMRDKYKKEVSGAETKQKRDKVKESKVKESKVKESKVKESKEENKERRKSKIYDTQSVHFRLANRLYQNILANNPDHKEPNLQKWADEVRLMMEQDKRTEEQIEFLIDWAQNHHFWKTNILSIGKLREQYDRLVMTVKEDRNKQNKRDGPQKPRAYQSMEDFLEEEAQ